jgi:hypothetical protein
MIEYDMTWTKPSKAQEAALRLAMERRLKKLTEFEVAAVICLSQGSLWHIQAKNWMTNPPLPPGPTADVWKEACGVIVEIVDWGYNDQNDLWWDLRGWTEEQRARNMLILMDFGIMLKQYQHQSLVVVSSCFQVFFDIVCGKNWENKFRKFLKKTETALKTRQGARS